MQNTKGRQKTTGVLSVILSAAMMLVFFSAYAVPKSAAAGWMQPSLDKLVSWNVIRGDESGDLHEEDNITRAEYISMINRAYGYDKVGEIPFTDVTSEDWFYDDIATAYNVGYFSGTSETTASPNEHLTREQAVTILGRNLMLDETNGEVTEFTDGRDVSTWSSGIVRTAKKLGIINGYPDGSFHPKSNISRAEAATMLANAVGTLVNESGDYALGDVCSNLTITSSGTTLKNTTVAGNLYISAGVDTGYITLENVKVLGDIIVEGSGESNSGNNSVLLRNVYTDTMKVDSLTNQFITIQGDGDTDIGTVSIRTPSYLEDQTPFGLGFNNIYLEGEDGTTLTLAGNIEKVFNKTPNSILTIAKGEATSVTVDEKAPGSSIVADNGAVIDDLNLDIATPVTGNGDILNLDVNAPGCTSDILPNLIYIRPGITAEIAGETMDNSAAEESSGYPRILAGYPATEDVASTSCSALFSTNKSGMIYWGVSLLDDGALDYAELKKPSSSKSVATSGSVTVDSSNTELTADVSDLEEDTTYCLSAVLVDKRGHESAVKTTVFSTPDDTVPAFASGYPYMSKITNISGQVTVMTNKSCKLYYALFLKGSTAPTSKDFLKGSPEGNLGYGSLEVTKNTTKTFTVNNDDLEELESYDLYLWLTDADRAHSSAVKKITFTTVDKTPPVFNTEPTVTSVKTTAIGLTFNLNENGTVYWVAVKEGTEYPKPLAGHGTGTVTLDSDEAKMQVAAGMNGLKSGSVSATENKDGTININGLDVQTAYDIYYVAKDKAGNYSETVKYITANTEDPYAPTVTQEFNRYNGTDSSTPLANTDIRIVFSEGVQEADTNQPYVTLYNAIAEAGTDSEKSDALDAFTSALRNTIQFYTVNTNGSSSLVSERTGSETNWVIDYRYATAAMEDGKTVITLPTTSDSSTSALNLSSGSTYYFQIQGVADTSSAKNLMGTTKLDTFTTVFAEINLSTTNETSLTLSDGTLIENVDMSFQMAPISTSKVEDSVRWDMLVWCDTSVDFELYRRAKDSDGNVTSDWEQLGGSHSLTNTDPSDYVGLSMTRDFLTTSGSQPSFSRLNQLDESLDYEYAIRFTKVEGESDRDVWSQRINCKITVVAGGNNVLNNLSVSVTSDDLDDALDDGATVISLPTPFTLKKQFTDQRAPVFAGGSPILDVSDSTVDMTLLLDRSGTIYYVIAKKGLIITQDTAGNTVDDSNIPTSGSDTISPPELGLPSYLNIVNPKYSNVQIKTGNSVGDTGATEVKVTGLEPETDYYVFFVLKGTGQVFSDVLCYKFSTTEVSRPKITLDLQNPIVNISTSEDAEVNYALLVDNKCPSKFYEAFENYAADASSLPAAYQGTSYTVLDAMIDAINENKVYQGSVFDIYASQTAKDAFAVLIRNQKVNEGGAVVMADSSTVYKDGVEAVNCKDYMSGSTWYCFLAVGKNINGTGDAFRAIRPVFLLDTQAPMVNGCNTTIVFGSDPPPTTLAEAKSRAYSGTLTVVFSEQLYKITRTSTTQAITPIEAKPLGSVSSGYVSLSTVLTLPISATISYAEKALDCSIVQFTFSNLLYNESITFESSVCDSNGNVHSVPLILSLNASKQDGDGNYIPYFTVSSDWDNISG